MTDENVQRELDQKTERSQPSQTPQAAQAPQSPPAARETAVAPRRKRPLISAIEIENFKGIGATARIELRPITLLFGQNSAGKSTVLHALCYAHEILSHRNVDVHRTELGGDRIDLGGFRNFVHGRDRTRTVRLRFDLNLHELRTPRSLRDALRARATDDGHSPATVHDVLQAVAAGARHGWLELRVQERDGVPSVVRYEIGVNGSLVGRVEPPARFHDLSHRPLPLTCNVAHPLFTTARRALDGRTTKSKGAQGLAPPDPAPQYEPTSILWRDAGHVSPLPAWNDAPYVAPGLGKAEEWALSSLLVGIGRQLRDALAGFRYVGPIRNLHRRENTESATSPPPAWADGSAAWTRLDDRRAGALIEDASAWLSRRDRLDTGYALRTRSILTIETERAPLLSMLREYGQLLEPWRSGAGGVDAHRWARHAAAEALACVDTEDVALRLSGCPRFRAEFARVNGPEYFEVEVDEAREGTALLDRYEEHLRASISVDAIAARIEAPDAGSAGTGWTEDDEHRLARLLARMVVRNEHRASLLESREGIEQQVRLLATLDSLFAKGNPANRTAALERRRSDARDKVTRLRHRFRELLDAVGNSADEPCDDLWGSGHISRAQQIEQQMYIPEMRVLDTRLRRAQEAYRRLTHVVGHVERRDFSAAEIEDLASTLASTPQRPEAQLLIAETGLPVRTSDVGVGVSQILPIVVAALDPELPAITGIEQPELHVHPRIQVELGDLFAQGAQDGHVFLIETHSEHLLLRLMRRIRQSRGGSLEVGAPALRPEDVAVHFVEVDPSDKDAGRPDASPSGYRRTLIREMPLNERGELVMAWPGGFFEEDLKEIF